MAARQFRLSSRSKSSHRSSASQNSRSNRRNSVSSASCSFSPRSKSTVTARRTRLEVQSPTRFHSNGETLSGPPSESDDGNDALNEVVMAVDLQQRDTVGCCFYIARDEKLCFMEDIKFGGVDVVDALRIYINPTVVLVSTKINDAVIDRFDPEAGSSASESGPDDQFRLPFLLQVRPPSEFSYEAAKRKLVQLKLGENDGPRVTFVGPGDLVESGHLHDKDDDAGQQGLLLRLAGWIDLESRFTVGCAGALLLYLQRRQTAAYLPQDQAAHSMFRISTLEMSSLRETMFINVDTLHSLQVMDPEPHPNSHNQGPTKANPGSKEGLSVYGIFHHLARTSQGKFLLRQYFLRPSLNLAIINARLDTIGTFLRPENASVLDALIDNLKAVSNMRTMMIQLRKGAGGGAVGDTKGRGVSRNVWACIRRFTFHALKIKDSFREMLGGEGLVIGKKVFDKFEGYHLAQVGRKISEIVDFDKSSQESRTVILPGVDEELDKMKRTFAGLDALLGQVARKLSENFPSNLKDCLNVIYFPQIGFLTTVPSDPLTGEAVYGGSFHNPWERMFSTEDQVYFKNDEMREMDGHFGDLYGIISDREIEISHELAQYVLEHEGLLTIISDICGEVDSLLALAQGARLHRLCRPQVSQDNILRIKGGRHILQELTVSSFVPNDTHIVGGAGARLSPDEIVEERENANHQAPSSARHEYPDEWGPNVIILTGPNYSGKSVYLKQVALIVFMAHIGSYVPAESAEIGLTDKILSRVTTRETVSRIQSAFMIDLQQISLALSLATRRSLLIIDEFGKGTDTSDGVGLACAVFEYLLNLKLESPKVIGATHFHEIFETGLLKPTAALAFGHMEVRVDTQASNFEDQITYLYNFREGRSTSSFGTCCAAMNGVPEEIVRRAENLILLTLKGEDLVAHCSAMPESEAAELKEAERIAREFLRADLCKDSKETLDDILTISATM